MNRGSALEGLKVLDLGRMVAGPFCASLLADMGADVIKIESPGKGDMSRDSLPKQDGVSTYFITFNRSKRGMTLNLKSEEGKEILRRLIRQSDVLIENFRPGVMKRLGFSYEETAELNPRLIYASISGFGQEGPYAERACFDPIAQAMSGLMSVTGSTGGENVRCGASIADIMAGQNAATAILAALHYRERTGKGQWIDIALMDACITALSSMNQIYLTTGRVPQAKGNTFEASAPGNSYPASDGVLVISAGQNSEWHKLCGVLGHPEWAEDPRFKTVDGRVAHRQELDAAIAAETSRRTVRELLDALLAVGLPAAPVLHVDDVISDPHFRDVRQMFADVEHPELGAVRITNQCIKMSETSPYIRACAPVLGQHNRAILRELGYGDQDILHMEQGGVV